MPSSKPLLIFVTLLIVAWLAACLFLYYTTYDAHYVGAFGQLQKQLAGKTALLNPAPLLNGAIALLIIVLAWGWGMLLLSWLLPLTDRTERHILSLPVGLFLLTLLTFGAGVVGLLYPGAAWGFVLFSLIIFGWQRGVFKDLRVIPLKNLPPFIYFIIVVMALGVSLAFLYSATPPIQSDAVRYHLAAPEKFILHHQLVYLPFNAFSNFPFNIEMLFTLGVLLGEPMTARILHFFTLLINLALIVLLIRELLGSEESIAPWLAVWIFFTIPLVYILSCWAFIDVGANLFFLAMLYCLLRWERLRQFPYLILGALFSGAAMGSKYPFVPLVLLAGLVIFLSPLVGKERRLWLKPTLVFLVIALVLFSPWLIKNLVNTGNPLYPFLYEWFDGGEWSQDNAIFYQQKAAEKGMGTSLIFLLTFPWNITFYWHRFEAFNPGLLFLLFLPLLAEFLLTSLFDLRIDKSWRIVSLFIIAGALLCFFGYQSNRFLIPVFALLAIVMAAIMRKLRSHTPFLHKILLAVILAIGTLNLFWSWRWIWTESYPPPLPYVLGMQSKDEYLSQALNYYGCASYLNNRVKEDEKVLFVGEHRTLYCRFPTLASEWFDTPYILHLIRQTNDNEELFSLLEQQQVSYVLFNFAELELYWDSYFIPRFTPGEWLRFQELVDAERLEPIFPPQASKTFVSILKRKEAY